jgi:Coenzyme PQQ synthesis protein D (PqqD)
MSVPKIDVGSVVCSSGTIPFARLHDDLLAIDQRAGYCYSMNPSAARIWELIPSPIAVSTVCSVLCREFGVDEQECTEDVLAFLGVLAGAGLVRVAD